MRTTKTVSKTTDTVIPVMRDALQTARGKGVELLDSDVAHEARRRGVNVVRAARGDTLMVPVPHRKRRVGLFLGITGLGLGAVWAVRRFLTQAEPYPYAMAPSGTVSSSTNMTTTPATPAATDDIDLRAGMRTTP